MLLTAGSNKENSSHGVQDDLESNSQDDAHDHKRQSKSLTKPFTGQVNPNSEGVWGRGRVTLVGDAAHATTNNGNDMANV